MPIPFGGSKCGTVLTFVQIGQTVAEIWPFSVFKMAAIHHLGFLKVENFNCPKLRGPKCVIVPNCVQIIQGVAQIWPFSIFQDGGGPPSCIFKIWKF